MATVRVEVFSFDGNRIRAGYDYDDQTDLLTSVWCENNTDAPLFVTIRDFPDKGKSTVIPFPTTETRDISSFGVRVVRETDPDSHEEFVTLPFSIGVN